MGWEQRPPSWWHSDAGVKQRREAVQTRKLDSLWIAAAVRGRAELKSYLEGKPFQRQWQHWEYLIFFSAFSVHVLSERYPVGSEDLKQRSTHSSSHQDLALGQGEGVGKSHLRRIHVRMRMRTHKLSNVTFSRRMVTAQLSPRWVIDP